MTSHCITWHDTTQAITSHQMTWPSHYLTPQQTSRHQNISLQSTKHHQHGTAEGWFTAKKWFGHRAGRSPCAHSIGKFFRCYIVLFLLETSAPGLSGHYWYIPGVVPLPSSHHQDFYTFNRGSQSTFFCRYWEGGQPKQIQGRWTVTDICLSWLVMWTPQMNLLARWWFQIFLFSSLLGEMIQFD